MKTTSRIFAVILTFMLLVTGMVPAFNVSAAPAVYKCELGVNKIQSAEFQFLGYNATTKKFYDLEVSAKQTWSPDWPGHFVVDENVYVVMKSEKEYDGALIDLMPDLQNNWGSVVAFTTPKAGKYNVSALLDKFQGADGNGLCFYVDVMLVKGSTGEILFESKKTDFGEIEILEKNLKLDKGETLYILVTPNAASTKTGSQNVALRYFTISEVVNVTTPELTMFPDHTTENPETGAIDDGSNGDPSFFPEINPIVVVGIVGGVLVLTMIVVVIALKAKRKK